MRYVLALTLLLITPAITFSANQHDLEKLLELKKTQPVHLDLSNTDLRSYPFLPGKIDLQQANISHSNLSGVDLSKINMGGADLSYADLSNAKLNQVNLAGANLAHANLSGAQIQQSDLSHTNLTCANLNAADLTKSTFTEANISGATFVNTITNDVLGYNSVIVSSVNCEG